MGLLDQAFDDVVRFIDVLQGATTQPVGKTVIFLFRDVVMCPIEQFERFAIAAPAVNVRINRRMVIQILAIIDRSALDLVDCFVDLGDGVIFFPIHPAGPCPALQMSARVAKIGEGMQVGRMPSGFVGKGQCGANRHKKCDYDTISRSLHSLLE